MLCQIVLNISFKKWKSHEIPSMSKWDVNIYVKKKYKGERKENKQPEDGKKLKELLDITKEESAVGKLSVSPHEHTFV